MVTQSITRIFLIKIGESSEVANNPLMKAHIQGLKDIGPYTEASEAEIEAYDTLYESLLDA